MSAPVWQLGEQVRVVRNVRDDGTYPGASRGELLVRRGSVGFVVDHGSFLMDQVIYSVHFLEQDRVIGCREEELMGIDEVWVDSRFEAREFVRATRALALDGEVRLAPGARGEILRVLRDTPGGVAYHVHFEDLPGRTLAVREAALAPDIEEIEHV